MTNTLTTITVGRTHVSHLVVACTGANATNSYPFEKPSLGDNADLLIATAVTTGSFSALVFHLEISTDKGVTWELVSSWDAYATPSTSFEIAENTYYRFNCTTFTGGTSVEVYGSTTSLESLLTTAYSGNKFLASPSDGSSGALAVRVVVAADVPNLNASKITAGILPKNLGGTGVNLSTSGGVFNGTNIGVGTYILKQDDNHAITAAALTEADVPPLTFVIQTKRFSLNANQTKALKGTPIEIVAGIPNRILIPLAYNIQLIYNGTPFVVGGPDKLRFYYTTKTTTTLEDIPVTGFLDLDDDAFFFSSFTTRTVITEPNSSGLGISLINTGSSEWTAGTGVLFGMIRYALEYVE